MGRNYWYTIVRNIHTVVIKYWTRAIYLNLYVNTMKTTLKNLDFLINHCKKTSAYLENKKLSPIQLVCVGLLERF